MRLPNLPLVSGLLVLLILGSAQAVQLPRLDWTERSDWLNVQTDVTPAAVGDGLADDTAALQAALDTVVDGTTVYLPPGTYRITETLTLLGPRHGFLLIGHGRDTTLLWDGAEGGKLFLDDGVAYSRYVGLIFEGQSKAAVGFYHYSDLRFETEVRHQHLAFHNFTDAGILAENNDRFATAETLFENCLFENCRRGVSFTQFNDYDYTFDGCEFLDSETAIECSHGNFYVRNCHFERSRVVDISSAPEHGSSLRRCTSVGSNAFLHFGNAVAPMTLQDCQIEGWTSPEGAVRLAGAPVLLFDCVFTKGPEGSVPIQAGNGQRIFLSENSAPGAPSPIEAPSDAVVYTIPAGQRTGLLTSARQSFFTETAPVPTKVFDAKVDFGAKGDGATDDTAAVQATVDAAREAGEGALAYLPTGSYLVTNTIKLSGSNYSLGGSGWNSRLVWRGAEGGTLIKVSEPQNVTLEHLAVGNHDSGQMTNAVDIHQSGTVSGSRMTYDGVFAFGMYQLQPDRKGFVFEGLGPEDIVLMPHVQGNLRFRDCGEATVLAKVSYEGSITVEGKQQQRGGLLGFQTRLATLVTHAVYLRDNQSLVASDFYIEQAQNGFVLEGEPGLPPGRLTLQGPKLHFNPSDPPGVALTINGYEGQVVFGPQQFYIEPRKAALRWQGTSPLDVIIFASTFYGTEPDFDQGEGLRLALIGNRAIDIKLDQSDASADMAPDGTLGRLADALDDLRRLGEVDLRLTHPEVL